MMVAIIVGCIAVMVGAVGLSKLTSLSQNATSMYDSEYAPTTALTLVRQKMMLIRTDLLNAGAAISIEAKDRYEQQLRDDTAAYQEAVERLRRLPVDNDARAASDQAMDAFGTYLTYVPDALAASRRNDVAAFDAIRTEKMAPAAERALTDVQRSVDLMKQDAADRAAAIRVDSDDARRQVIGLLVGGLVLALAVAAVVARSVAASITTPVRRLRELLGRAADGDLTISVSDVRASGEVGLMVEAVATMVGATRDAIATIARSADQLAASSEELSAVSQQMGSVAVETEAQAAAAAAAAEQVSTNVESVSAGAAQVSSSIGEIASNSTTAAQVAGDASRTAHDTEDSVAKLGESSQRIGQVVDLITSIAEQTNLLALNATIEAARAGEAGRGFAVVANEVKDLAAETAKATNEIAGLVEAIQTDTGGAVYGIGQITAVIDQISEIQATIASAVEEQATTTNEIGRSVGEAASGATEIAGQVSHVASAASDASHGANQSLTASGDLAHLAADLQRFIARFRYDLDSAPPREALALAPAPAALPAPA